MTHFLMTPISYKQKEIDADNANSIYTSELQSVVGRNIPFPIRMYQDMTSDTTFIEAVCDNGICKIENLICIIGIANLAGDVGYATFYSLGKDYTITLFGEYSNDRVLNKILIVE